MMGNERPVATARKKTENKSARMCGFGVGKAAASMPLICFSLCSSLRFVFGRLCCDGDVFVRD